MITQLEQAEHAADDPERLADMIGAPFPDWGNRCHEISLKLLRTGEFGPGRIARGWCRHIRGQHSWIVLGDDCYSETATIVDPTLCFHVQTVTGIFVGRNRQWHRPHGTGSCFSGPMPSHHGGPDIDLGTDSLSPSAASFLSLLLPLDRQGWGEVAHMPVEDWPAAEIIAAMADTPELRILIPIDILGMLTDRNPGGFYR